MSLEKLYNKFSNFSELLRVKKGIPYASQFSGQCWKLGFWVEHTLVDIREVENGQPDDIWFDISSNNEETIFSSIYL